MKTQRLDWMKFFVADFMTSEAVEVMSDAEVGQYCLLMFTAWLGANDCTLPNAPPYLARHARCEKVSDAVMAKFTLTPEGRLVNEVQQKIYREQVGFYEAASASGKKGRAKQLGKQIPAASQTLDDVPGVAQGSSEAAPGDKNGNNENEIEIIQSDNTALHSQRQGSASSEILSANGSNKAVALPIPESIKFPSPVSRKETTPVPSRPSEPLPEGMWSPQAANLARIFHSHLPPDVQADAPKTWESLWAQDMQKLLDSGAPGLPQVFESVILYSQQSKWKKYVKRGQGLMELYPKIYADWRKLFDKGKHPRVPAKDPQEEDDF